MEAEENNLLRGNKTIIHLNENYHQSYVGFRKLPIHILPMVVAKFKKKMIQKAILDKAPKVTATELHWL